MEERKEKREVRLITKKEKKRKINEK